MKRIYLFTLLVLTSLSLSLTAAHAQSLDPGCSPQMWGYMENQADAMRARNKAYEREILNRQPSTLYLTCFDQAMALSARLGFIFSDNVLANPPPANNVAFDAGPSGTIPPGAGTWHNYGSDNTVAFAGWGARQSLAIDLDNVVTPEFNNWLDATAPGPALFNFLPQWNPANNQLTTLATALKAIMMQIQTFQGIGKGIGAPDAGGNAAMPVILTVTPGPGILKADEEGYIKLVKDIDNWVKSFPTITLTGLPDALADYTTLTGQLDTLVKAIEANRLKVMGPLLAALKDAVMDTSMTCTRMDDLWNTLDTAAFDPNPPGTLGAFYPPEGKYYLFSPFYSLQDLLTPPNPPSPPAMKDFVQELGNMTDNIALAAAFADIMGPLAQAAPNNPLWPAPPAAFPPNASEQYVINQM